MFVHILDLRPCCRNSNNEDGDFEGTLPVEMTKTQRLDFIKERLVVKVGAVYMFN
jgi:hypothetical protein